MNYVRLGDLCVINSGGTPRRNNKSYWKNGDIPWVKISDLKNGIVESTEEFITLDGLNNSSAKIFPQGTLLYTIFATIGEVAILKMDAATNQAIVGIQLKENQKVYLKYIYYYLKSQTNNIKQLGRGVAQNNINLSVVKNMIIPIVSLEKQSNIIATLNKLEKIKENRITILNCLDDLIKSRFVEMFGDLIINSKRLNTKRLDELFLLKAGITTAPSDILTYMNSSHKYLCYGGNGVRGYVKYFSYSGIFPLIGRQGALCGNVQLAQGDFHATEHAILVKPLVEYIDEIWSYYALSALNLFRYHTGAAQPGISVKTLNNILLPIPILSEQKKFVLFSNQINKLKSDVQKSIDETQLLMDSLMKEYFG